MNSKDTTLWILIALLVAAALLSGTGMMGFGMIFGGIIMVLFWGAIIWLVISLINTGAKKQEIAEETALDILKKRYAKGEITRNQYLEMEKDLNG